MTSNEIQPQNIKSLISQQPLIRTSSDLKLKQRGPNQNFKNAWNEDDHKLLKVLYLSNCWSDLPQNIISWNFSNHWLDHPKIVTYALGSN